MLTIPALNSLHYGDNLHILRQWPDDWVDIVYGDPPFNSKQQYNQLYALEAEMANKGTRAASLKAFDDTWHWMSDAQARVDELTGMVASPIAKAIGGLHQILGDCGMMAYVSYMAIRLIEIKRVLKPTGSVYLHCDDTAGHYLKIVMDTLFGADNFRNEIVWKRRLDTHNLATSHMGRNHDIIFYYVMSPQAKYRIQYTPYDAAYIASHYKHQDAKGLYRLLPCTNEAGGNKPYTFQGITRAWRFTEANMKRMHKSNMLVQLRDGGPFYYKKYLSEAKGVPLQDIWTDIAPVRGKASLGYNTQKPIELLERIICSSSDEGDIVLDPFCGCGTTVVAADTLNRKWIGIDINPSALDVIKTQRFPGRHIPTYGVPADLASAMRLAGENRRHFEIWAVNLIPGLAPNERGGADGGIDGIGNTLETPDGDFTKIVLGQVKSGKFSLSQLRDFLHVVQRENAVMGVYITLEDVTSSAAQNEVAKLGNVQIGNHVFPRVQLYSVERWFHERLPRLPDMINPYTGKPLQRALPLNF